MIIVLGAFDGFHRGHALLLDRARELSERRAPSSSDEEWAVVTFSPHPDSVVRGDVFSLFSEDERDLLVRFFNIPHIKKIPFDEALSRTTAEGFVALLESLLPVTGVIVGEDFRFGHDREGDAAYLRDAAGRKGWLFEQVDSFVLDGTKVGSSDIKKHVISGDIQRARTLLGYPFLFRGRVVSGDGRGRTLGFPTANIEYPEKKILPQGGVYAASVLIGDKWWPGALNIGCRPTFLPSLEQPRCETYVLDLDESLYGRTMTVFLESFLRPEIPFESTDALLHQMQLDVLRTRECFQEMHARHGNIYYHLSKAFS